MQKEENAVVRWYPSFARNFATIKVQLHPLESGFFARLRAAGRMLFGATAYVDLDRKTMNRLAAHYNINRAVEQDQDADTFFNDPQAAEQEATASGL